VKACGLLAFIVLASAACASSDASLPIPDAPSGPGGVVEGNVNVTRVRAFIKDGRVQAFVEGELGDGCTSLKGVNQRRSQNAIEITVTFRRQGEVCTMIMQYLNEWVALDGPFEPGTYTVRANARVVQFRLLRTPDGSLRVDPDPGPLPQQPYLPMPDRDGPPR